MESNEPEDASFSAGETLDQQRLSKLMEVGRRWSEWHKALSEEFRSRWANLTPPERGVAETLVLGAVHYAYVYRLVSNEAIHALLTELLPSRPLPDKPPDIEQAIEEVRREHYERLKVEHPPAREKKRRR